MKGGKMTKRFGFTLAEVLITLTIIGTVAAMTVPNLMNSTATQENTAAYKKLVSSLNQAITMQYALEGTDMRDITYVTGNTDGALNDTEGTRQLALGNMIRNRLQVVRTIDARDAANGHPRDTNPEEAAPDGGPNPAYVLSDGAIIEIPVTYYNTRTSCAANRTTGLTLRANTPGGFASAANNDCLYSILVDVNGNKGSCVANREESPAAGDLPRTLAVTDCFWLDVYPTEVRPGDWTGRMIMYNNSTPRVESPEDVGRNAAGAGGEGN